MNKKRSQSLTKAFSLEIYRLVIFAFDKYIFIIAQIIFQTASMTTYSLGCFKSFNVFIRYIYYNVQNDYLMNFLFCISSFYDAPTHKTILK